MRKRRGLGLKPVDTKPGLFGLSLHPGIPLLFSVAYRWSSLAWLLLVAAAAPGAELCAVVQNFNGEQEVNREGKVSAK